jgi:hypothetical protein
MGSAVLKGVAQLKALSRPSARRGDQTRGRKAATAVVRSIGRRYTLGTVRYTQDACACYDTVEF